MVNLSYDNHLETRLIEDKKPEPESDNRFVATVTWTLAITFTLEITGLLDLLIRGFFPPNIDSPDRQEEFSPPKPTPPELPSDTSPKPGVQVQINQCNGADYDGANFRDYPARTPLTIRGIVLEGQLVTLTGEITDPNADPDGIKWYGVINDFVMKESDELNAQNQTNANQTGWIAACFIE